MASFKLKFLKSTNSLIFLLISILGFSLSCKKEEVRYEYGTPHASFIVKGIIESDLTNNSIPDIIVEMRMVQEVFYGQPYIELTKTGFSDTNGNYNLTDGGSIPNDQTYQIKFIDTDGALNGEYETLDTTIVFKDPIFTGGDGNWYMGAVEQEVNIKLKPKK
jgi:putative lipoprotein (rSAM/lipoprotein system)